jgi:hypothetical protein
MQSIEKMVEKLPEKAEDTAMAKLSEDFFAVARKVK